MFPGLPKHHLPSRCAVCHSWPRPQLCASCLERFAGARPRCARCALTRTQVGDAPCPDCRDWALEACHAAVDYAFPWNELLTAFKFQRQSGYSELFAGLLLRDAGVRALLGDLGSDDVLMPLPLSAQRLAERGFNQAWELARSLHRLSGCKARLQTRLLLRTRQTLAQSQLDRAQRLANVRDAFLTEPLAPDCVRGRAVVLVDDVMTSGATLNAAAQSLLQAGAKGVQALVVARTPS